MKNARGSFFYRILRAVADEEIILDMAEFSFFFTKEVSPRDLCKRVLPFPFSTCLDRPAVGFKPMRHSPFKASQAHRRRDPLQPDRKWAIFPRSRGFCRRRRCFFLRLPIFHFNLFGCWRLSSLGAGYALTHSPWFASVRRSCCLPAYVGRDGGVYGRYIRSREPIRTDCNGRMLLFNEAKSVLPDRSGRSGGRNDRYFCQWASKVASHTPDLTRRLKERRGSADACPVCRIESHKRGLSGRRARPHNWRLLSRGPKCSSLRARHIPHHAPASMDPLLSAGDTEPYGPLVTLILGTFYRMRVSRWAAWKPKGGSVLGNRIAVPGLMLAAFLAARLEGGLGIERNEEVVARVCSAGLGSKLPRLPVEELPAEARFRSHPECFTCWNISAIRCSLLRECAKRLGARRTGGCERGRISRGWQARFCGHELVTSGHNRATWFTTRQRHLPRRSNERN